MNGYWKGENLFLKILLYIHDENILITIPSEDIVKKDIQIKKIKHSSIKFVIYTYMFEFEKANEDVLYGSFCIMGNENSRYPFFLKRDYECGILKEAKINRLEELRNAERYLFEEKSNIIFRYPNVTIGDYYLNIRKRVPINIEVLDNEILIIRLVLNECFKRFKHNGKVILPEKRSGLELMDYANNVTGGTLNCRGLAIVLTDIFLAYGFKARNITCMQKEQPCIDSHVVTIVYSKQYNKWIYADPSYNLMIYNKDNMPLSLEEIRQYIIDGNIMNPCIEAEYNNHSLDFNIFLNTLIKKMYRFFSPENLFPGHDNVSKENEIELVPANTFKHACKTTSNPHVFWRTPEEEDENKI